MVISNKTTLKELHDADLFSVRTVNALHAAHIENISDILAYINAGKSLLSIRSFGKKSQLEVDNVIAIFLSQGTVNDISTEKSHKQVNNAFQKAYNETLSGNENVDAYVNLVYENAPILYEQIFKNTASIMQVRQMLSMEENILFRKYHIEVLKRYLIFLEEAENPNVSNIKEMVEPIIEYITLHCEDFSLYDISTNFLSDNHRKHIEQRYEQMCSEYLSVRAQNFKQKHINSFDDLVKLFDQPITAYNSLCPGQSMRKTLTEIYKFNQSFKQVFLSLYNMDVANLKDNTLKHKYPFLLKKQRDFVSTFVEEHENLPVFYLLFNFLRASDERCYMLYSLHHGIFDNCRHSLEELAESTQLSRERVRQIVCGEIPIMKATAIDDSELYQYKDLQKLPFIYEGVEPLNDLLQRERIKCNFHTIASIIQLVFPYSFPRVKGDIPVLVRDDVNRKVNLKEIVETIESVVFAKYPQDTVVNVTSITKGIPEALEYSMRNFVVYVLTHIYGTEVSNDGMILFTQNCIDIENELYQFLEEAGSPLHVEDLFNLFKEKYPDHKYTDPIQIKPYLLKSDRIGAIGKTSTYALTAWSDVYFGSIRELLIEILSSSKVPVHISSIMDKISPIYPSTNRSSVESTMQADTMDRFLAFEGGYYGLSSLHYDERFQLRQSTRKMPFDERLKNFKTFVDMYHRFPISYGGENETSLQRWHYNVVNRVIRTTTEQRQAFDEMLKSYEGTDFPRTQTENEFKNKCAEYKKFIREQHRLPSSRNGEELYSWFRRSLEKHNGYTDQRYGYFKDLINYIESFGFII